MNKLLLAFLFVQMFALQGASAEICVEMRKFEKSLAVEIVDVISTDGVDSERYSSALELNAVMKDFASKNNCKQKIADLSKQCSILHASYAKKCKNLVDFDLDYCSPIAGKLHTCNNNGFTR